MNRKIIKVMIGFLFLTCIPTGIIAAEEDTDQPEASTVTEKSDYPDVYTMEDSQADVYREKNGEPAISFAAASPWWEGLIGNRSFYDGNGTLFGLNKSLKIIDVSEWNGVIDWNAVKQSNEIDGVILRVGFYFDGIDKQFSRNIAELNRLNIPYGLYLYSYAVNAQEAKKEAEFVISMMKQYNAKPLFPIYYDIEKWPNGGYRNPLGTWVGSPSSVDQYRSIISEFMQTMHNKGLTNTYVYSYRSYVNTLLNHPSILNSVAWVAEYNPTLLYGFSSFSGFRGWQYTSSGGVTGISGNVDISSFYQSIPSNTQHTVGVGSGKGSQEPTLYYQSNVSNHGWLSEVSEPNTTGTTGKSTHLQSLKLRLANVNSNAKLTASVYSASYGWIDYANANQVQLGKDGYMFQQVKFSLLDVQGYALEYRVHSSSIGWQAWTKQNVVAGTQGYNIEAIEFRLVKVADSVVTPKMVYTTHMQNMGWLPNATDSQTSGNPNKGIRLEAIQLGIENVPNYKLSGSVHVQNVGWIDYSNINSSTILGTTGKSLQVEAVKFNLTGLDDYRLEYRVYSRNIGWSNWMSQGQTAGITGMSIAVEGVQFRLLKKSSYPNPTEIIPQVIYQGHSQNIGWMSPTGNGNIAGTSGKALRLEAVKLSLIDVPQDATLTIDYHVQNIGWKKTVVRAGQTALFGTTGNGLRLEGIKLDLDKVPGYKLQYSVHIQNIGWTNWIEEGNLAGTTGRSLRIEAIKIRFVKI